MGEKTSKSLQRGRKIEEAYVYGYERENFASRYDTHLDIQFFPFGGKKKLQLECEISYAHIRDTQLSECAESALELGN